MSKPHAAAGRRWLEDWLQTIWRSQGPVSTLLLPLARLYGAVSRQRMAQQARHAWRAPVPVIVIGNILVGGTGKTPVTQAVCQALLAHGHHPGLISRGYGSRIGTEPHLSDSHQDSNWLGDEPALLHAATGAPVAVHPQRALAARALLAAHPEIDVLIADDGLQHRALARDLEIIVQDSRGIGNGRLLPAGPLRELPARLTQANWLITHLAPHEANASLGSQPAGVAQITMRLQPDYLIQVSTQTRLSWPDWQARFGHEICHAAAGIGQPQRFFQMLRHAGLTLGQTLASPDHQAPDPAQLRALPPGPILITAKDAVKYTDPDDHRLWTVYPTPRFSDPNWLDALVRQI
ncbi:tetraacyldisaccharide 4'-kinase [Castellaniella sp.]|uniref:tetraacyldisaccharide 4'-kinase n=1 Tax=Castellaniella sp. TaxID=1955812 RepID=UPI002AFFBAD0|nr:tetraacyldisaccharide 4'-kinase [Castellaniella sp.]